MNSDVPATIKSYIFLNVLLIMNNNFENKSYQELLQNWKTVHQIFREISFQF